MYATALSTLCALLRCNGRMHTPAWSRGRRQCASMRCAGNDFSTLYAPLIRDGRMEKYYWNPTRTDRIGVCKGIFKEDNLTDAQACRRALPDGPAL